MLWATLPLEILLLLPISVARLGWFFSCLHAVFVITLTILLIDVVLLHFRKIPFTCVTQVDVGRFIIRMLATLFAALVFVPILAAIEHWMFEEPLRFGGYALVLAAAWYGLARFEKATAFEQDELVFEDRPRAAFELLKLT